MYEYRATIVRVIDGDTFTAEVDLGFNTSVYATFRVKDLDTPETFRPRNRVEKAHGETATAYAKKLLPMGEEVTIKTFKDKTGKYGRMLADVILPNGGTFTEIMKDAGFEKREEYKEKK